MWLVRYELYFSHWCSKGSVLRWNNGDLNDNLSQATVSLPFQNNSSQTVSAFLISFIYSISVLINCWAFITSNTLMKLLQITVSLIQWHFYKTRGPIKVHFHELNVTDSKFLERILRSQARLFKINFAFQIIIYTRLNCGHGSSNV